MRPHLDYGAIIYDNPGNSSFIDRLESIQYNAALAITGCIRGTSKYKLYNELGFESLEDRRWCRRLVLFYKIEKGFAPKYLSDYLPKQFFSSYSFRSRPVTRSFNVRTERFRNSFFPFCLSAWNKLDCHIRDLPTVPAFKRAINNFYRPVPNSVFSINNPYGIMHVTRLRVGLSHLKEHKFRHNFQDTTDPFCDCRSGSVEDSKHYLLHCSNFNSQRLDLFNGLSNSSISLLPFNSDTLLFILLYGFPQFTDAENNSIISAVIKYIIDSDRFSGPLLI